MVIQEIVSRAVEVVAFWPGGIVKKWSRTEKREEGDVGSGVPVVRFVRARMAPEVDE